MIEREEIPPGVTPSWYIYILCDPRTDDPIARVRYVGVTKNIKSRLSAHIADSKLETSARCAWVQELLGLSLRPVVEVVDRGTLRRDAGEAEKAWIAHYQEIGCGLTNGSTGNYNMSCCIDHEEMDLRRREGAVLRFRRLRLGLSRRDFQLRGGGSQLGAMERGESKIGEEVWAFLEREEEQAPLRKEKESAQRQARIASVSATALEEALR